MKQIERATLFCIICSSKCMTSVAVGIRQTAFSGGTGLGANSSVGYGLQRGALELQGACPGPAVARQSGGGVCKGCGGEAAAVGQRSSRRLLTRSHRCNPNACRPASMCLPTCPWSTASAGLWGGCTWPATLVGGLGGGGGLQQHRLIDLPRESSGALPIAAAPLLARPQTRRWAPLTSAWRWRAWPGTSPPPAPGPPAST